MNKILHINDYPVDTPSGGGAEVVMRRVMTALRERGYAVESFTVADLPDGGQENSQPHRLLRNAWRYVENRMARQALHRKLQAFRPEVVHLHNYYHELSPGVLAELERHKRDHGLRVVMTAHDYHLVSPNSGGSTFGWWSKTRQRITDDVAELGSLRYRLTRRWDHRGVLYSVLKLIQHEWNYRWFQRHRVIDEVICASRFVQKMLAGTGLKTSWLPHPAPRISGQRSGARDVRPAALRFVFAGRVEPEKGLYEFLQTLPEAFLKDAHLTIIGRGTQLSCCQEYVSRMQYTERVHFVGHLDHTEALKEIGKAHVLVQPSRVLETYGLTLIEALAQGTNILASSYGALPEIVHDAGVGHVYDVDNPASLAKSLERIRRGHEEGSLNRFDIASFLQERSEGRYVERLIQLYEDATAARSVHASGTRPSLREEPPQAA